MTEDLDIQNTLEDLQGPQGGDTYPAPQPVEVIVTPKGASDFLVVLFSSLMFVFGGMVGHFTTTSEPSTQVTSEQIQVKSLADTQAFLLESNKLDQALRMQVAKDCVAKGYIPTILNGNVDCKPGPTAQAKPVVRGAIQFNTPSGALRWDDTGLSRVEIQGFSSRDIGREGTPSIQYPTPGK